MMRTCGLIILLLASAVHAQSVCAGASVCERMCQGGSATACTKAARLLEPKEPARAVKLLGDACDLGDGAGCAALANMYEAGRGVPADATRADSLRAIACQKGHATSCARGKSASAPAAAPVAAPSAQKTGATLEVDSTPGGAVVEIDGVSVGGTPWNGDVSPGSHTLKVDLPGYLEQKKTIKVKSGAAAKERFTLKPENVRVTVKSVPPKATLRIDSLKVGVTPWSGTLQSGPHALEVSLEGFETAVEKLDIPGGTQTYARDVKLQVPAPQLEATSTPSGADVLVDDVKVGVTPFQGPVRPGTHRVLISKEGFDSAAVTLTFAESEKLSHKVTLAAKVGTATVMTVPSDAAITIDGAPVGISPVKTQLAPGRHRVRALLKGHDAAEQDFTLEAGTAPQWTLTLKAQLSGADLPPPPPPPQQTARLSLEDPTNRAQVLRDPKANLDVKRSAFAELSATGNAARWLQEVQPSELRDELCLDWAARFPSLQVVVTSVDSFDDEVAGQVQVNGRVMGTVPFDSTVPMCASRISVKRSDTGETVEKKLELADKAGKLEWKAQFPGRRAMTVYSLLGEYHFATATAWDGAKSYPGGGFRVERYGRYFHLSLSLKVTTIFAELANIPVVPAADLFFGMHVALGNADPIRFHLVFDLGAWTLVCPTGRVSLVLNVYDRFFLSVSGDVHLYPLVFIPPANRAAQFRSVPFERFIFFGGEVGIGGHFG